MEGLVKLAWSPRYVQQAGQDFMERANQERFMDPEKYRQFVDGVQKKYNINVPVNELDDDMLSQSMYIHPVGMRQLGMVPDEETADGMINSARHKEITLHEMGHAQDKNMLRDKKLAQKAAIGSGLSFYGGAAAPGIYAANSKENDSDAKKKDAILAGSAAVGGGLAGLASGKLVERTEDRANDFVKKVLTDELGSAEKAKQAFNESVLPSARKTYSAMSKFQGMNGLVTGGVGGAMGLAGAAAIRHNRNKQEQQNNQ
ncbi:hypothetical protein ACQKJG_18335 [Priestia megaterium]|uniref:hypothetical protein n=1 Tax=Priestia megaterium TaxID=1404 RepID=UPI003D01B4FA